MAVNYCKGRGYDAFQAIFRNFRRKLSVFYHRGDSGGENGSGFCWLDRPTIKYVLAQLELGGMIVSDGSMAMKRLSKFHRKDDLQAQAVAQAEDFVIYQRHFTCVRYLGHRYGPTLAWKVIGDNNL